MPGYVIHLAVANEYVKKHPNEIKNLPDFFRGNISPDLTTKDKKGETHYGETSSVLYLRKYFEKNNLESDYSKGYFLHLVTDYIFYNKILEYISKDIYNDYDILNRYLMEKYDVKLIDEVKDNVLFKEGNTKILNRETAEKTIDIVSNYELKNIKEEILSTSFNEKWEKIRLLKRLD